MQQRYYDPGLGRFLSVDPVTMYGNGDGDISMPMHMDSTHPIHSKILMAVVHLPSPVWRRRWHGGGLWDSEVHESRKANQQDRAGNCRRCWSCNWWYQRPGGWSPGERDDFDRSGRSNSSDGGCRDWCCGYGCTGRNRRNTSDKRSTGLIGCRRECWQFGGQRNWKLAGDFSQASTQGAVSNMMKAPVSSPAGIGAHIAEATASAGAIGQSKGRYRVHCLMRANAVLMPQLELDRKSLRTG